MTNIYILFCTDMQGHSRPTFGWSLVASVLNSLIFTADKCPTPILCLLTRIVWRNCGATDLVKQGDKSAKVNKYFSGFPDGFSHCISQPMANITSTLAMNRIF